MRAGQVPRGGELDKLDLLSVLQASQLISAQTALPSLIDELMRIIMENAGAERGVLLLRHAKGMRVRAVAVVEGETIRTRRPVRQERIPYARTVARYVMRTCQGLVLEEATESRPFSEDPHVSIARPRSVLCAPVLFRGKLTGALYLENNLLPGAFTAQRLRVVDLLSTQVAISLENARLYRSLERDLAMRKRLSRKLRRSRETAQTLLDALSDTVVLLDRDGRILGLNRAMSRWLDAEPADLVGRSLWSLLPEPLARVRSERFHRLLTEGEPVAWQDTHHGNTYQSSLCAVGGTKAAGVTAVMVCRDVTEERRSRLRLMQADRLASLGVLVAGVAHEIGNPNHVISLSASMLRAMAADMLSLVDESIGDQAPLVGGLEYAEFRERFPEMLAEVDDCSKRIAAIVRELKDFSRQEEESDPVDVDMEAAVSSAVRLSGAVIRKATDDFCLDLHGSLPPVVGNPRRIEQVVVNLLQNACQATRGRTERIRVSTGHDPDEHTVWVEVSDEGYGIPADVLQRITDPFFTTKREMGGTGLGLSVSDTIAREHGGRLSFLSSPDHGTRARLVLPAKEPS